MAQKKQRKEEGVTRLMLTQILNQDIKWHRQHPGGSGCGRPFEGGFITGLEQAKRLIRRAFKVVENA